MHARADDFVVALREAVLAAEPRGFSQTAARLKAEIALMDPANVSPAILPELMRRAGVEDGQLPRTSAELNQVLNVLPPAVTEYALIQFMNERYIYRDKK
jgi:hypothetical protein